MGFYAVGDHFFEVMGVCPLEFARGVEAGASCSCPHDMGWVGAMYPPPPNRVWISFFHGPPMFTFRMLHAGVNDPYLSIQPLGCLDRSIAI